MKIILASASPRRRELLTGLGLDYTVLASSVEEQITEKEPARVVEELSAQKAGDVLQKLLSADLGQEARLWDGQEELLVIGADTIVAVDGQILGKPASAADAAGMLGRLSARRHQVYTGVTLYRHSQGKTQQNTFHECTQVHFYPMTEEEISWYISTEEPMDKAGAYGIQGLGGRFIRAIEGDYSNVVGLPVARLYQELRAMQVM
ncbi:MAG: Maf family protein [Acetatifactor sp.]|nr:Maf family protein [Acetatifactor sp.]